MRARATKASSREADKGTPKARDVARAKGRAAADTGEVFGRRVGRAAANLEALMARPHRSRDGDSPAATASERRAGTPTARRNVKRGTAGMTSALEDSRTKPSRKSTRKSANRSKSSQGLERNAHAQAVTSKARALRARSGRGRR